MIDGPLHIRVRDEAGELTDEIAPGEHYQCSPEVFAEHEALLGPHRVSPARLQNVYAGDDPDAPAFTVPLRFPDEVTAAAVRAELMPGAGEEP